MSDLGDAEAREAALDPTQSFIVQAPAGSGKTELLIQRYMALLVTVQQPEQVVAITFTRKAAAEMRRRVLRALRAAGEDRPSGQLHERTAFELARAVIARDREHDWQLLAQPQRLRIDTLDAFNAWLARQLPVLADGVAAADVVDKAEDLYRDAARRCVEGIAGDDSALAGAVRTLLRDVGNDCAALEQLLAALLPRRDQWLRLLADHSLALRPLLEGALQRLVDDELAAAAALVDPRSLTALAPLLRHAAGAANDALRATLAPWLGFDEPPRSGAVALAAWRGIAALLLTKQGEWRRRVAKPEGFGPEHAELRERLRALLDAHAENEPLRAALQSVSSLPDARYTEPQWQSLAALRIVLVRLAAELKVAFAERRAVDFVELALAAQRALGHVDAPSELLLALDRRIQHLLVDEFQDTSQSQRRLLELLTAGWQPDDGRTLFLVGDPMQSIYRFRDADMSLFLLAKRRGIGAVRLHSLTLQRNFRSAPAIVQWVNAAFARVFPAVDDVATGRAAFRDSVATRGAEGEQLVRAHSAAAVPGAEVDSVAAILATERRRYPKQSIAVLVQNRKHLEGLRERLRDRGLAVHAVEIDSLGEQSVAQDLAGLTRALLHLDDRIAWLAVLRAPWCGLSFADLEALCGDEHKLAVWALLQQPERLARLSADGRQRALSVVVTLTGAFAAREHAPLSRWIERTWSLLGGPACLDDAAEQLAAEQFFALLAAAERSGDLDDPALLQRALEIVQPQADAPRGQGIEIMTMHRAKGLEFDTVVLLGLAREPRPDEPKALQWLARTTADGRDDLIMVPTAFTSAGDGERLADFVRRAERERDAAERARLLYVATTRARERLHLVWQLPAEAEAPPASSLLAHLWPLVSGTPREAEPVSRPTNLVAIKPVLRRLVAPAAGAANISAQPAPPVARPEFVWAGHAAVHVGTVVHRYLQRIAEQGLERWSAQRVGGLQPAFARELELLGVEAAERTVAAERVSAALSRALDSRHGRFVLEPHDEARSELRLTLRAGSALEHIRLDRTFVAEGKRWIVDFKTSQHEGSALSEFLDSEVARYAPQLERYAAAVAASDSRPVQLALYFPLLGELRAWPAAATASRSD
ncbi:MAG TPA: UvrD-helicase domain-containing protein [Gammaproteobacteria bacterium]|nr:UvrD-helicase domain-containing protein [Gammaproteobacteria bacterium]